MASTDTNIQRTESDAEKPTVEHTSAVNGNNTDHIDHPQRTVEEMEGSGGLKGLIANPFVFATAVFASLGGLLFGCKAHYWCRTSISHMPINPNFCA
jgi:hypothetical protein